MRPQSRGEMTYHEKIFVDFAEYYREIISDERQEEIEAKLYEDKVLTDEESDEIYKNMFQAYMDELYSLVKKGQECINSQPNAIITIARPHVDENRHRVSGLLP
ncbi:MAG: hypothetical protein FAF03_06615 [Epsilonproteobacteria bacterium]|nr:hypothetical protein [Campylobacterota bacterium]